MLAADKLQLQSALKQQATALKEKEFQLHHSNLMTVGTQAAVLAGLDITMFIEFNPPEINALTWPENLIFLARAIQVLYYTVIVGAFCANIFVVAHTTTLSVLGAGLALRGPDGSMMTATDGLYQERSSVFRVFGLGLGLTLSAVLVGVWLLLPAPAAFCTCAVAAYTCRTMWLNYYRVFDKFDFDEAETVDFRDIMEGPANIRYQRGDSSNSNNSVHSVSSQTSKRNTANGTRSASLWGSTRIRTRHSTENEIENDLEQQTRSFLQGHNNSPKRRSNSPDDIQLI